ncbi:MAG: threonylcarbamoyl-AMP synthase [Deltaproteobacteria bacterium]|nr:threonylcarbamoyl-AMP synthase [Deltaproteobacteria bacterium]
MAKATLLVLDEHHPAPRKIAQAAQAIMRGEIVAYPTDTVYALGCHVAEKKALDRLCRIKDVRDDQLFAFICPDISTIAKYTVVDDFAHRWLRRLLPGPYTIILPASRQVPKLLTEKRREIGVRIPDNRVCQDLVDAVGGPIVTTSATDPQTNETLIDPELVRDRLGQHIALVLDAGLLTHERSTVLRIEDDRIEVLREGKGPTDHLPLAD